MVYLPYQVVPGQRASKGLVRASGVGWLIVLGWWRNNGWHRSTKKKLGHFVIFMLCLRIQTYGFLLSLFLRTGVEPSDIFFIVASSRWCFRLPPLGVVGPCSCKNAYCSCWTLLVRWSWSLSLMSQRVIHEVLMVMMVGGCWWWWWLMVGDNDENGPLLTMMMMMMMMMVMMMMMMMMMIIWTTTCIFQLGKHSFMVPGRGHKPSTLPGPQLPLRSSSRSFRGQGHGEIITTTQWWRLETCPLAVLKNKPYIIHSEGNQTSL